MSLASLSLSLSLFHSGCVNNGLFAHVLHDPFLLLLLLHAPVSGALGSSTVIPNCYTATTLSVCPLSTTPTTLCAF
uniref:Putative secreted protein n=1 Tax=Anopheles darlingi TaxID=43151 RepID=A0A2M4DRA1_ANODA